MQANGEACTTGTAWSPVPLAAVRGERAGGGGHVRQEELVSAVAAGEEDETPQRFPIHHRQAFKDTGEEMCPTNRSNDIGEFRSSHRENLIR